MRCPNLCGASAVNKSKQSAEHNAHRVLRILRTQSIPGPSVLSVSEIGGFQLIDYGVRN